MFLQFWIISEDSRRLPKISEGNRRGIKIAEDRPKIVRRTLRKLSPETKNPPETVNIKKLANLTANTKNYGQITPNIKPHSDPLNSVHVGGRGRVAVFRLKQRLM